MQYFDKSKIIILIFRQFTRESIDKLLDIMLTRFLNIKLISKY